MTTKTVYIDVVDTTNLLELVLNCVEQNFNILASTKTSKILKRHKIPHLNVDKLKEWVSIHHAIQNKFVDIVVVNIPDTMNIISKPKITIDEVYSKIDIPKIELLTTCSLYPNTIVLTHPNQYSSLDNITTVKSLQHIFAILQQFNSLMSQFLYLH